MFKISHLFQEADWPETAYFLNSELRIHCLIYETDSKQIHYFNILNCIFRSKLTSHNSFQNQLNISFVHCTLLLNYIFKSLFLNFLHTFVELPFQITFSQFLYYHYIFQPTNFYCSVIFLYYHYIFQPTNFYCSVIFLISNTRHIPYLIKWIHQYKKLLSITFFHVLYFHINYYGLLY